jgi:hypothetical protein
MAAVARLHGLAVEVSMFEDRGAGRAPLRPARFGPRLGIGSTLVPAPPRRLQASGRAADLPRSGTSPCIRNK